MPGSDGPDDRRTAPDPDVRGYGRSALAAAALCVLAVAALNILIDPFWRMGVASRTGFDPAVADAISVAQSAQFARYLSPLVRPEAEAYLVGTSRLQYGLDVCPWPAVQKLSIFAADLDRIVQAQNAILRTVGAAKTLVLELSGVSATTTDPAPARHPFPSRISAPVWLAFSYGATKASLTLVADALAGGGGTASTRPCAAPAVVPPSVADLERQRARQRALLAGAWPELARFRHRFGQSLADADRVCHERGLRHRILWLMLPLNRDALDDASTVAFTARLRGIVDDALAEPRPHRGACDIAVVELGTVPPDPDGAPWRDPALWQDHSHFGAALGERVLNALPQVFPRRPGEASRAGGAQPG